VLNVVNFQHVITLKGWGFGNYQVFTGYAFLAMNPTDARKYLSKQSAKQNKSAILVTGVVDWSWSDIIDRVGGVVTDHGTRVSRGAEVAGLLSIPAVLGTNSATREIKNGDRIRIVCEGNKAYAYVERLINDI
jgi:pyruvate,water dikinase